MGDKIVLKRYALWVCNRIFAFVTFDGLFFGSDTNMYLSMGRVLDVLHCNIKCYKSKTISVHRRKMEVTSGQRAWGGACRGKRSNVNDPPVSFVNINAL